jgi:hypothetical protein
MNSDQMQISNDFIEVENSRFDLTSANLEGNNQPLALDSQINQNKDEQILLENFSNKKEKSAKNEKAYRKVKKEKQCKDCGFDSDTSKLIKCCLCNYLKCRTCIEKDVTCPKKKRYQNYFVCSRCKLKNEAEKR